MGQTPWKRQRRRQRPGDTKMCREMGRRIAQVSPSTAPSPRASGRKCRGDSVGTQASGRQRRDASVGATRSGRKRRGDKVGATTSGRKRQDESVSRKSSRENLSGNASSDPAKALAMSPTARSLVRSSLSIVQGFSGRKSLGTYLLSYNNIYSTQGSLGTYLLLYNTTITDATQDLDDATQDL